MIDLLTDEEKYSLMNIRERTKDDAWFIGDTANAAIERARARGLKVSKDEAYRQVSNECGRPARTVRYYARIAGFYAPHTRSEYDILSFEHFRVATGKSNWQDILEDAVAGIEDKGRPQTVEYLERKYIYGDFSVPNDADSPDIMEQSEQIDAAIDSLADMVNLARLPEEIKRKMRDAIGILREALEEIALAVSLN